VLADAPVVKASVVMALVVKALLVAEAAEAGAESPVMARIPATPVTASHLGRIAGHELHRLLSARPFVFNSLAPRSGF
jgi:hypothetical protein